MGFKIRDNNKDKDVNEYMIDTPEDLESLPKNNSGSVAICVSTADVYMLNTKHEWVKL